MICKKEFAYLIERLLNADDPYVVFREAFDEIGKLYGITKLNYQFVIPANQFVENGETRNGVLYKCPEVYTAKEPAYVKTYVTGENGKVRFEVFREEKADKFTEEEICDIDTILNIFMFHGARTRMINMLQWMKSRDSLTGLPNSFGFLNYADTLIEQNKIDKFNSFYFNLSRFSLVNKRFGANETDRIIVRYARALQDFLVEGELLCRLGGDNFAALIYKERTEAFLQLLSGVITYGVLADREMPVKISAVTGVLEINHHTIDRGSLLNDTAMAMNVAKHMAKKQFVYVSEQLRNKGYRDKQIVSGFSEALYKGEFLVYYQPKVSGEDYRVVGAEALSRWYHEGEMLPPLDFIPVIERNGMVCLLDFYVLEQVCKDVTKWLKKGINVGRISINFSRKHLSNPHLVENIMDVLRKYDMAGRYIEIELTETVDEVEAGLLIEFIKRMKYHKVRISIDDFGTGYSSLNMLRSFSVDVLKIDKSFIDNLDERNKIVLSNIVRMAHDLNVEVVAEGVETKEQALYLGDIGCHTLQGFLFDKPLPKEEFEAKLQQVVYSI